MDFRKKFRVFFCIWALVSATIAAGAPVADDAAKAVAPDSPEAQVESETVVFRTDDSVTLHGTLYRGSAACGLILVPGLGGSRGEWEPLARALAARGAWVLAIDLRGQGDSLRQGSVERSYTEFGPADYRLSADKDLKATAEFLGNVAGIDESRMGFIGASVGANAALVHAADNPGFRALAMLSPGLNYRGLLAVSAIKRLGGIALFMAASEADHYSADTIDVLTEETGVPVRVRAYEDAGHGTQMLSRAPGLTKALADWIEEVF